MATCQTTTTRPADDLPATLNNIEFSLEGTSADLCRVIEILDHIVDLVIAAGPESELTTAPYAGLIIALRAVETRLDGQISELCSVLRELKKGGAA